MRSLAKIVGAVVLGFILLYLGLSLLRSVTTAVDTETVYVYTASETVNTIGIAVRDETVIQAKKSGVVGYNYPDGTKVASGTRIVENYQSRFAILLRQRLEALEAEEDMLEEAQETGESYLTSTQSLSNEILRLSRTLAQQGQTGDMTGEYSNRLALISALCKKKLASGTESGLEDRIQNVREEIEAVSVSLPTASDTVDMPQTGTFSSVTDGLESTLTPEVLLSASFSDIQEMLELETHETRWVGKTITGFKWYFAVVVSWEEAESIRNAGDVTASFPTVGISDLPLSYYTTVSDTDVASPSDDTQVAVIFTCNRMDSDLSGLRIQNVVLSLRTYTGLRVSKEALRFVEEWTEEEDGTRTVDIHKGVYVQLGVSKRFRNLDDSILYEGEDYILVEQSNLTTALQQYDKVIVRGLGV